MDTTTDISDFEIPPDGKDLLAIGDFEFKLLEKECNWGTGGFVRYFYHYNRNESSFAVQLFVQR